MENPSRIIEEKAPGLDKLVAFCDAISDDNPIHRELTAAQIAGSPKQIVVGTYLAARALYHVLMESNSPAHINELEIQFPRRVHIDDPIKWTLKVAGSAYLIEAINPLDKVLCEAKVEFGPTTTKPFQGPAIRPYNLAFTIEQHAVFKEITGLWSPWALGIHIAQMAPSMLLKLLKDTNNHYGTEIGGFNAGMKQHFKHEVIAPNALEGRIIKGQETPPRRRNLWDFPFAVSFYNSGRQISSVEVLCKTTDTLNLSPFYAQ